MTVTRPAAAVLPQIPEPAGVLPAGPARGETAAFADLLNVRPGAAEAGDAEHRPGPYAEPAQPARSPDSPPGAELKAFLDVEFVAQATGSASAGPSASEPVRAVASAGPAGESAAQSVGRAGPGAGPASSADLAAAAGRGGAGPAAAGAPREAGPGLFPAARGAPVRGDTGGLVQVRAAPDARGLSPAAPEHLRGAAARPILAGSASSARNAATSLHLAVQATAAGLDVLVRLGPMGAEDRARLKSEVAALLAAHGLRIHAVEILAPGPAGQQKGET